MKVFVLGLDGMTFNILQPYIESNLLPNFKKVMQNGFSGKMRTSIPPVTGPGWTALTTGKEPGKHGVFEFRKRDGYQSRIVTKGATQNCESMWTILSRNGKQVVVVNVPLTYPPDKVNGVMVSGLMTPGVDSPFAYPEDVKNEIFNVVPGYRIDVDETTFLLAKDKGLFLNEITRMTEDRRKLMNHFMATRPWDLFFIAYVGIDRIQHFFWDEIMARKPECVAYYQLLDAILGDVLAVMDDETALFVVSDHGFTDGRRAFCINTFFKEQGLSALHPKFEKKTRLAKFGVTGVNIKSLLNSFGLLKLKNRIPAGWLDRLKAIIPNQSSIDKEIDWSKTKVFSFYGYGLIHINLEGREPMGIVPADEYDALCDRVIEKLTAVEDPESGQKIAHRVFKGRDIYSPADGVELPDLVLVCNEGFSVVTEFGSQVVTDTRFGNMHMTGNHDLDGVCMAYGKMIKPSRMNNQIYDVFPTVLHLMGVPLPPDLDGKVLTDIFYQSFDTSTVETAVESTDTMPCDGELSEEDKKILEQRLKNLGYLS